MDSRKKGKPAFSSLRQFSWSGKKRPEPVEELIGATALVWYDAKHRAASPEEVAFVNSIRPRECPFCGSTPMKDGHREDGVQRYKCYSCGRRFTALTGTVFDSRKIPLSEWVEYLIHLLEFHSVRTSSFDNRNAKSTGRYWLVKVFEVLRGIQDPVTLSGRVWIDETFLPVAPSKRKSRDGRMPSGISRNLICVATGVDSEGRSFMLPTGGSKITLRGERRTYLRHIAECSTLIHDGEHAHQFVVDELALRSEVHETKETKGLADEDNPMDPINDLHSYVKRFMRARGGYSRKEVGDWMNLIWFILNGPEDKMDKVKAFVERAIRLQKRVRYRDAMRKK